MKTPTDPLHITPEVIRAVEFTPHRLLKNLSERGYDETEVDDFLDLVEERVAQLMRENDRLTQLVSHHERYIS